MNASRLAAAPGRAPGGQVLAFAAAGSVAPRLVLAAGDVNLTFKRYLADAVVAREGVLA